WTKGTQWAPLVDLFEQPLQPGRGVAARELAVLDRDHRHDLAHGGARECLLCAEQRRQRELALAHAVAGLPRELRDRATGHPRQRRASRPGGSGAAVATSVALVRKRRSAASSAPAASAACMAS